LGLLPLLLSTDLEAGRLSWFQPETYPANQPLIVFSPGKARHLCLDRCLEARAIMLRKLQLIELLHYFLPEKGALCR
jgi:hypothetical protein